MFDVDGYYGIYAIKMQELIDLARDYKQEGVIVKLPGDTEGYEYKPSDKVIGKTKTEKRFIKQALRPSN
jgi:hypothetical protein